MKRIMLRLLTLFLVAATCVPVGRLHAQDKQKTRPRTVGQQPQSVSPPNEQVKERLEPDDTSAPPRADVPAATLANRQQGMSEEEQGIVPYYNNYLASYRLGPEDIISVSVFNLDRYSKAGITVPPNGVIALPLIPDGIFVVGKTTEQVAAEVAKRLDEFVIEPKITVTLERAQSAVFSVLGDVAQPGVRPMTHRVSAYEAVTLAGGVLSTGNSSKVVVARRGVDGYYQPILVNIAAIAKGKQPDSLYLNPGDQVFVPGNRFKSLQKVFSILPIITTLRIFAGGF